MITNVTLLILATLFAGWRAGRRTRFFLHRLQLAGYKVRPYRAQLKGPVMDLLVRPSHLLGLFWLVLATQLAFYGWPVAPWILSLAWAITFASSRRYRRDRTKKPPVWTARMKRLAGVTALLQVLLLLGCTAKAAATPVVSSLAVWFAGFWAADLLAPWLVALAAILLDPLENAFQQGFKREARARLADRPDLTTIAITGSYGKTSVKFAVRDVLAQRYPVLATPGSFNTPMGICTVINNQLSDDHPMMVLEMGIRHKGDIAELVDIAPPHVAVVTCIGVAHLESMGSIEAIAAEKLSLIDALAEDGTAVVNGDDDRVLSGAKAKGRKLFVVSTRPGHGDCWAEHITYDARGARFEVVLPSGQRASVATTLLGRHNILNLLLAIGVGLVCGLRLRQAVRGAARAKPVPHRLALRQENGLNIIDDAFNSNPVGAANAVEVLGAMPGRRVIVTPGMVELGAQEADLNRAFGGQIAAGADDVLLVGPERTRPIREGLESAGFPVERIHPVRTLFQARAWIAEHCTAGDTILYENDLPDQYTEAAP
ncbi:MAG: UDP-N-acetylmuramoyl-tripeptide--D-alanyl-D-alanine ligase [Bacteroidetes bacterium]|nr:UDP-N-acetylmuramoyl-tripeptide--D-alanyl-D-alanine ligase [Bacteroidota bacterium]MDA0874836.1 UDP-N-acetylmuramoyl-tripeptide--D-alanyl-D-alanine ligase [Bacteroidota bacterium]